MNVRRCVPSLIACAMFTAGCALHGQSVQMAELTRQKPETQRAGMASFTFADFGGLSGEALETNAVPWKLVATALLMSEEAATGGRQTRADLPRILQRFGFVMPDSLANWDGLELPAFDRPIGLAHGMAGAFPGTRIEVVNLSCASCHGGVLYDSHGQATRTVWLGLPNTSLDLEAYSQAVYQSLLAALADRDGFGDRIEQLFSMGFRERTSLRWFVLPRAAKRLAKLEATMQRPSSFENGGPGRTNGTGALRRQLGLLDPFRFDPEIATISIPNLAWRGMRSSLLVDGSYGVPGHPRFQESKEKDDTPAHRERLGAMTALFTMGVMGLTPKRAAKNIPEMRAVMEFLEATASPPFPGSVDDTLAAHGRALFEKRCSGCHGTYAEGPRPNRLLSYPNRLVLEEKIGSDSLRWIAVDSASIAAIARTPFSSHIHAARTGGYVPPILSAVWATSPYLHNGSVPTVWHMMHPDSRPERFEVGGHRLDFERLGIAGETDSAGVYRYPAGYVPWSRPAIFDTRAPGLGNQGHEAFFRGLDEPQKRSLIEFLKCL